MRPGGGTIAKVGPLITETGYIPGAVTKIPKEVMVPPMTVEV
jgi:hypothetical protein